MSNLNSTKTLHPDEYLSWQSMRKRCKSNPAYSNKAPPAVWDDFTRFLLDMGPKPSASHTLDRVKNELPYGPGNCRWATHAEQSRNKSNNINVVYLGAVMCFKDACRAAGVPYGKAAQAWHAHKDMERASGGLLSLVSTL